MKELHSSLVTVLGKNSGRVLSVTSIVDIMNLIGKCVIAGNVRRTAEIAFGDPGSEEYIDLKNYDKNPHRQHFGWTSNNSVFASLGMDYAEICERVCNNGEPGFAWLENMQAYSRMNGKPDYKDIRARGGNPCLEQTLESNGMHYSRNAKIILVANPYRFVQNCVAWWRLSRQNTRPSLITCKRCVLLFYMPRL